ncbi:pan1 [Symbiodinium natans]|uniref:Pan1 protein n=1 Tax=Symbiodinium natans TaxID=878477 RepID=A0A812RH27_9DINO|nr:pan1 [Symbiodinium natans]
MTLAERRNQKELDKRRQGAAIPYALPGELQALSQEDLPAQVASVVEKAPERAVRERDNASDALWEPSVEELGEYKQLFLGLVGDSEALLGTQAGKEVLERSGLPLTELAAIWYLADVDGDGQLALCEFACAMHLTARRRAGSSLPEELPSPLTRLVAGAVDFPEVASPLPQGEDDSRWAIDPDLLNQYRQIFDSIERRHADSLSAVEAQEVLQRSKLSAFELEAIWQLSDVDQESE